MTIQELLYEEIADLNEKLKGMKPDSKEYSVTADRLDKLMTKVIDMEKFDVEQADKKQLADDERKDRVIKNIISGAGIILPIVLTIWGTNKSLKFEETGTVTTIMGRGFLNKLLPKK